MKKSKCLNDGFSESNRRKISFYVLTSIFCVVMIWISLNYLSTRATWRSHVSQSDDYSLSPLTRQILNLLDSPLEIVLYFNPDQDVFQSLEILTREYSLQNPNIKVSHVDYLSDPAAAKLTRDRFKLAFSGEKDVVLLNYKEGSRAIMETELSVLDVNPLIQGTSREIKRSAFKGEQALTSAILSLTLKDEKSVAFVTGHKEFGIDDSSDQFGFSRYAQSLEKNLCKVSSIELAGTNNIPSETSLLVLANPSSPYARTELRKIADYLNDGGKVLAFLGSRTKTGLEPLLAHYGIGLTDNVILDVARSSNPSGTDMSITNFNSHPLTKPIYNGQLYMVLPRSVHSIESKLDATSRENLTVEEIIFSNPGAQEITQYDGNRLVPSGTDRVGEFPLAVLATKNVETASGTAVAQLLVVGESIFLANTGIQSLMNYEFGLHCANFLMERDLFINNIPPRPVKEFELVLTKSQKNLSRWLLLAVFPGIFFLAGLAIHLMKAPTG